MQGSFITQKMNPQASAYGDKRGGWCDDGKMKAYSRKPDNSKSSKRNYSDARKLKESSYVYSE